MAYTLSIYENGGAWFASVLGPNPVTYEFISITDVAMLRIGMGRTDQTLIRILPRIFKWNFGLDPLELFNSLFVDTSAMIVNGEMLTVAECGVEGATDVASLLPLFGDFLEAALLAGMVVSPARTRLHHFAEVHQKSSASALSLALVSGPNFNQTWLNFSKTAFKIQEWSCNITSILGNISQQPASELGVGDSETLAWSQDLSGIYTENVQGSVSWTTPDGKVFGVLIDVPRKLGGFGRQPYYLIWKDGAWDDKRRYAETYTYPEEIGYKIVVRPVSGESNMACTITVADLPKEKGEAGSKQAEIASKKAELVYQKK